VKMSKNVLVEEQNCTGSVFKDYVLICTSVFCVCVCFQTRKVGIFLYDRCIFKLMVIFHYPGIQFFSVFTFCALSRNLNNFLEKKVKNYKILTSARFSKACMRTPCCADDDRLLD